MHGLKTKPKQKISDKNYSRWTNELRMQTQNKDEEEHRCEQQGAA